MTEATESPAEMLRRAANLMRERAEAAPQGPWFSWMEGRDHRGGDSFIQTEGKYDLNIDFPALPDDHGWVTEWQPTQDYVASWHPLVALAVAALLDKIAWMGEMDADLLGRVGCDEVIAIARAYLGETEASDKERTDG